MSGYLRNELQRTAFSKPRHGVVFTASGAAFDDRAGYDPYNHVGKWVLPFWGGSVAVTRITYSAPNKH